MDVIEKCCFVLWLLSVMVTAVVVCDEGQGSGCDSEGQQQHQQGAMSGGPTREEVMQMVQDGYARSLQQKNEAIPQPATGRRRPTSFGSYLRRKRSANYHGGFGTSYHHDPPCPAQADQSQPYGLGSDPTGYPTDLIAAELFQRSLPGSDLLFQCLAKTITDPEKGPAVEPQPFLQKGTTCPQSFQQLWTYNSLQYGDRLCWALTNFQENILYTGDCQGKPCLGCSSLDVPFSFDFSITYQKQCLPRFSTVSLWAFCPSFPEFQRIVRDRIVVPVDCSCTTVTCQSANSNSHY